MSAEQIYRDGLVLIQQHGWKRVEEDSGWFWHGKTGEEATFGEALDSVLAFEGVDTRKESA